MEFTPRKPVSNPSRSSRGALRHSPYATPGREYLNRFHQKKASDASSGSESAGRRFFRFSRLERQIPVLNSEISINCWRPPNVIKKQKHGLKLKRSKSAKKCCPYSVYEAIGPYFHRKSQKSSVAKEFISPISCKILRFRNFSVPLSKCKSDNLVTFSSEFEKKSDNSVTFSSEFEKGLDIVKVSAEEDIQESEGQEPPISPLESKNLLHATERLLTKQPLLPCSQKTQRDVIKSVHKSPMHGNKDSERSVLNSRNEKKTPKWLSAPVRQPSFPQSPSGSPVQSPTMKTFDKPTPSVRSFNQQLPSVKTQNKPPLHEVKRLPLPSPVSSEKGCNSYASASDSDDEVFLNSREEKGSYLSNKEKKISKFNGFISEDPDKENSHSPVKRQRVYANKRKPLSVVKSRLLCDVSSEKIERAYNTKVIPSTNEPVFAPVPIEKEKIVPHRIGFPNYGNTCYINSVMQSLFGLPPFVADFKRCATKLSLSDSSLFMGLNCLLNSRNRGKVDGVTNALRKVKQNLEKVDDSFQGFKMQDANEFLTLVLDTIKEEINRCHSIFIPSTSTCASSTTSLDQSILTAAKEESMNKTVGGKKIMDKSRKEGDATLGGQVSSTLLSVPPSEEHENSRRNKKDGETASFVDAQNHSKKNVSNLVNENFEFELLESYRCLGCGEVEGKKQKNYGLYVNLSKDSTQSLQDALGSYMSTDERDFHCSKCGHKKFTVLTTFTRIPRILIVQLNRYKYSPTQGESLKVSSRVHINRWLCLDAAVLEDTSPPEPWNTVPASCVGKGTRSSASVVRHLSSELNTSIASSVLNRSDVEDRASATMRLETTDDEDDTRPSVQVDSEAKKNENHGTSSLSREDEELEEVMRRSLEDFGGKTEEDEIQQAIRLSLQDQGMTYAMDNLDQGEQPQGEDMIEDSAQNVTSAGNHTYRLASIISHFGCTTNVGHYVSDVYNFKEKRWFHYDDDKVGEVNAHTVYGEGRQKNAYIFFYMHRDLCQQVTDYSACEAS